MSYLAQSRLAADQLLMLRVSACAASEGVDNPSVWSGRNAWELSTQPGWAAAYGAAEAAHLADPDSVSPPGENEGAITDAMILAAVTKLTTTLESPAE